MLEALKRTALGKALHRLLRRSERLTRMRAGIAAGPVNPRYWSPAARRHDARQDRLLAAFEADVAAGRRGAGAPAATDGGQPGR